MKNRLILLLAILLTQPSLVHATDHFVSPTGKSTNTGTKESPWDLVTAISDNSNATSKNYAIKPGDTVWLTQGTYGSGAGTVYGCNLVGTKGLPVIVRQAPGHRAIIDGSISVQGAWSTFWGFEITNSSSVRKAGAAERLGGLNFYTPYHKAINLVIHDVGHPGIGIWTSTNPAAIDATDNIEIYGVIMWGNGIYDTSDSRFPDGWTRGSGVYAQNRYGKVRVEQMVSFKEFTIGIKVYTQDGYADNFELVNNVVFDNNFEEGMMYASATNNPINDIKVLDNFAYSSINSKKSAALELGYRGGDLDQTKAVVQGNYFVGRYWGGSLSVIKWKNFDISNNTFVTIGTVDPSLGFSMRLASYFTPLASESLLWDNNTYYGGHSVDTFYVNGNTSRSWDQWKAVTGFDQNSTRYSTLPTTNKIAVLPNKYEPGRALIVAYNWENLNQIQVDLSLSGLQRGDQFVISDVQNLFGDPVAQGLYRGSPVSLPTNLTSITPLMGATNITHFNPSLHTDSGFNTYLVQKVAPAIAPQAPANLRVIE